jgi:hypothetical protein
MKSDTKHLATIVPISFAGTSFEPLWTPADAASFLRLHEKTVIKMARLGQIPS